MNRSLEIKNNLLHSRYWSELTSRESCRHICNTSSESEEKDEISVEQICKSWVQENISQLIW